MHRRSFTTLLGVGLLGLALAIPSARGGTILAFSQDGTAQTVVATNNGMSGASGGTVITVSDIKVTITAIDPASGLTTPITAWLTLTATSVDDATSPGGHVAQDYQGTFSFNSNSAGTGTNILSGSFTGGGSTGGSGATVFGAGSSLVFSASSPNGIPSFTSSVIPDLAEPRGMSLSFTNVVPQASITGTTIAAFTSNISGTFSAVPEPTSVALLGIGMTGFLAFRRFFKRTSAA